MTDERTNPDDFYFVLCDGEPIQPANTDMIMDYWTAETVQAFLEVVNPDKVFTIVKAELVENPCQPSPEFIQAYQQLQEVIAQYGENSDQATMQMVKTMSLAPDELQQQFNNRAKELGLMPNPSGFDDDGQPVYDIATVAKHFGMAEQDVLADMDKAEQAGISIRHRGNVNLIQ